MGSDAFLVRSCSVAVIALLLGLVEASASPFARDFESLRQQAEAALKEAKDHAEKTSTGPRLLADRCVDFSGTWEGSCVTDGEEPETARKTIVQTGCEVIEDPESETAPKLLIGKPNPVDFGDSGSGTLMAAWNDAQNVLGLMASYTFDFQNGLFVSAIMKQEMSRNGDLLFTEDRPGSEFHTVFGVLPGFSLSSSCVYHKVAD